MSRKLITAPAAEPVSLTEAKLHLRLASDAAAAVAYTAEDTMLSALIQTARERVEAICRRALISQTWELYLDEWPLARYIRLPLPPLVSVASVKYTDTAGTEHTFSDWTADTAALPPQVVLRHDAAWPSAELAPVNPIVIRFTAGYGAAAAVPASIRAAMLLLIGQLYEHREESVTGTIVSAVSLRAIDLLGPYIYLEL